MSSIKHNAELRHVLSHLMNAIEHLAHGSPDAALHELESIEPLVFFESDEEMRAFLEGDYDGESETAEKMHLHGETEAPTTSGGKA